MRSTNRKICALLKKTAEKQSEFIFIFYFVQILWEFVLKYCKKVKNPSLQKEKNELKYISISARASVLRKLDRKELLKVQKPRL